MKLPLSPPNLGTSEPSKSPKLGGFRGPAKIGQISELTLSFSNAKKEVIFRL
jgi:hypothetical protein